LLIPLFPLYMDQCMEMLVLGLDTNQLLGTTQKLNQVHQVALQLFKKGTKFYEKYGSMNIGCDFFHPIYFSPTFYLVPRIPTKRFMAPIQVL
jgi:hypothetical protein